MTHDYDARDQDVLIQFPVGTLGDILAWFPYAARFGEVHRLPGDLRAVGPDHPAAARRLPAISLRHA